MAKQSASPVNRNLHHRDSKTLLNKSKSNFDELHQSILSARGLNSSRISNRSGSSVRNKKVKLNLDVNNFSSE